MDFTPSGKYADCYLTPEPLAVLLPVPPPVPVVVFVDQLNLTVYFGVVAAYAVVPLANRLDKPTAKHNANTAHNSIRKMLFLLVFTT